MKAVAVLAGVMALGLAGSAMAGDRGGRYYGGGHGHYSGGHGYHGGHRSHSSFGLSLNFSSGPRYRPVYVAPQPVYIAPQPVYVSPAPVVYAPAPVVIAPPVVYHQPAVVYSAPVVVAAPVCSTPAYYGSGVSVSFSYAR